MENRFSKYAQPADPITKQADPLRPGAVVRQGQEIEQGGYANVTARNNAVASGYAPKKEALSVQKTTQEMELDRFKTGAALKNQYDADPRIAAYRSVAPQVAAAMAAPNNAQGDLSIIYGFAKVMDPGSAVRGEEMELASGTSPLMGRIQSYVGMVSSGKRLPENTRRELINTMRERGNQFNLAYSEARKQYLGIAKQGGFDVDTIIGPHDGGKYQKIEANYKGSPVVNLDGSQGAAPDPNRWKTVSDKEVRDFIIQNQGMDPAAMADYAKFKLGRSIDNLPQVMDHLKQTGVLSNRVGRTEASSSVGMGLAKGGLGALDRAAVGLESVANLIPGMNSHSARDVMDQRAEYFSDIPTLDGAETVGRLAGATALTWPLKGPMLAGAAGSALMGNADTGTGVATEAIGGAVGGKIGSALLGGAAQMLAPKLDPAVRNLASEGARLTPGRFFPGLKKAEDLARSYPIIGSKIDDAMEATTQSVNRIPANRALGHIGQTLPESVPAGNAAVNHTEKAIGDVYDNALSGTQVSLDPTFMTRLGYLQQRSGLRPQEMDTLNDIVEREVGGAFANGRGQMSGQTFKRLDSRLGNISSKLGASIDDPFKGQLGESVGFLKDQLGALMRRQNPDVAAPLRGADKAWADFVPYQRAAAMDMAEGLASPGQFASGVRQSDRSLRKGATARGEARMQDFAQDTAKVLPATRGNSGSSDRANLASPSAWALGSLLSPLYSEPALNAINRVAARNAGPFASLSADTLRKLRPGASGALIPWLIEPGQ